MALTKITSNLIGSNAISAGNITDASITADDLNATLDLTAKTVTVATASAGDNDTSVASTAFVKTAIDNIIDGAPAGLNTLNEIAASLNDDTSLNATLVNSIATKLPLAGGTLTGALTVAGVIDTTTSHNLAINTPNSTRINIDSNADGSNESFIVGKDQTTVNQNNILFKVQENGRVGIGNFSDPDADLEVRGSTVISTVTDGVNSILMGLSGSDRTTIQLDTANTTHTNRQWGLTNIAGDFYIGRHGLNVMTMLNDGKVGIGTGSPSAPLHITHGTPSIKFTDSSSSANYSMTLDGVTVNNTNAGTNGSIAFHTHNGEKLRLGATNSYFSNTNVGIGTSNPSKKLHVNAGSAGGIMCEATQDNTISLKTTSGGTKQWNIGNYYASWFGLAAPFILQPVASSGSMDIALCAATNTPAKGIVIKASGNVGIGLTSPDTLLHINATNNSAGDLYTQVGPGNCPSMTIQNAGTTNNNNAALFFKDNDGHVASVAARFLSHTGGDEKVQLRFSVTGSGNTREKVVITEDGHMGIKTMTPYSPLQVIGTVSSGTATKPKSATFDANGNMNSFEHVFSATKATTSGARNMTLVDISGLGNFHQAIFIVEYATRLQAISDATTGFVHRVYGINRFNGGTLQVTETNAIAGSSNSLAHALVDVEVVSNTQYRIRVEFSSSVTSSSFASGSIRAYGSSDYFPTISFAEGMGN